MDNDLDQNLSPYQPQCNDLLSQITPQIDAYCRANMIDPRLLTREEVERLNLSLTVDNVVRENRGAENPLFTGIIGEEAFYEMLGQTKPCKTPNDPKPPCHHKDADKNGDGVVSWEEALACEEEQDGYMQGYGTN